MNVFISFVEQFHVCEAGDQMIDRTVLRVFIGVDFSSDCGRMNAMRVFCFFVLFVSCQIGSIIIQSV